MGNHLNRKAFVEARLRAGLSVQDLADATGVHKATIHRIELGTVPRAPTAKVLADHLRVDVTQFLIVGTHAPKRTGRAA